MPFVELKAKIYNIIGPVHGSMNNYPIAISFYMKAFETNEQFLASDDLLLAVNYNNIGINYFSMDEFLYSLTYLNKVLEIREKYLPSKDYDLVTTYRPRYMSSCRIIH
jgi:tetratricopeptide (TPR) repeat protein